ncbi:MAG: glucose-1-phosphate adenylyltransferase [Pseudomonadota bacterium]
MPNPISIVLAGGQGERLRPLTNERTKPAVPFGGHYRIIDFVLSNLVNSGLLKIKVLTQFKADSLLRHLKQGWYLPVILDQFIDAVPAQMRTGGSWYKGSADAVYQNLHHIENAKADPVLILSGDQIYRMDMRQLLKFHDNNAADVTIAATPQPLAIASNFGVIAADENSRMIDFQEKPNQPPAMPGNPDYAYCSAGIYVFKTSILKQAILADAQNKDSKHDFGKNIIPAIYKQTKVMVYNLDTNKIPGITEKEKGYWRDVGSIDQYWQSSLDLVSVSPVFNLYNYDWPIHTARETHPPAKFVFADETSKRIGMATDSMVCDGVIISGGRIQRSVLSPRVRINSFAEVEESILFDNVNVGRYAKIRRAIIDKNVTIPPKMEIGYDLEKDKKRFTVSPEGIVVIPKDAKLE